MKLQEFEALFEKHEDEFIKFERVSKKRARRPDLNAFLLLDELQPSENESDLVSSAEHDEIWLDTDVVKLVEVITEEQVIELIRCGVRYDSGIRSLCLFV